MLIKKKVLSSLLLGCSFLWSTSAFAKLKVVTSVQTFASVAKEIGGDKIEVASLSRGNRDPHFIDAKPSLASILAKADMLIYAGLGLESGWLPTLITSSRNPSIAFGGSGHFNASKYVRIVDVRASADRSLGDIHPAGNPHYFTSPKDMLKVARAMADTFSKLDSKNASSYEKGYSNFEAKLLKKIEEWESQMAPFAGAKIVTFHRSWIYLTDWLDLNVVGYIEPKPGITPDPSYLASLVSTMRTEGVKLVMTESYYNPKISALVAKKAGATLLNLPANVGGTKGAKDYISMMNDIISQLQSTLSAR